MSSETESAGSTAKSTKSPGSVEKEKENKDKEKEKDKSKDENEREKDVAHQEPLSWSSVGGYDHPQPGSRLLQYGKYVRVMRC